jgi:hypothetical protein
MSNLPFHQSKGCAQEVLTAREPKVSVQGVVALGGHFETLC